MGAEVSKLSHAWILRYKTCLYALVEDFMVAGGMWRKMIASRHQQERERVRGEEDTLKELVEWREAAVGLHGPLGNYQLLGNKERYVRFSYRRWKEFKS